MNMWSPTAKAVAPPPSLRRAEYFDSAQYKPADLSDVALAKSEASEGYPPKEHSSTGKPVAFCEGG